MPKYKQEKIAFSDITDEKDYLNRKEFIQKAGIAASALVLGGLGYRYFFQKPPKEPVMRSLDFSANQKYRLDNQNTYEEITNYNNFYEFSLDKEAVAEKARGFPVRPWTIRVEGEVNKPADLDIDALLKDSLEERIYRLRCVEAWSMVVPWVGIPLHKILNKVGLNSHGRYVEFTTVYDPEHMPNQRRDILDWPYTEALRLDEALHPLTFMVVGLYGKVLPPQNGAPLRLVVPWKYGFKSAKSIVKINVTRRRPRTTWSSAYPSEYGFYANVNPNVDHPRWSQAMERKIGEFQKKKTLLFNGYAEEVGSLYKNMDLKENF